MSDEIDESVYLELEDAMDSDDGDRYRQLLTQHPEIVNNTVSMSIKMSMAARAGQLSVLRAIVGLGIDVNAPTGPDDPQHPLYWPEGVVVAAAGANRIEVVRWLLDQGAKLNFEVHGKRRCVALLNAARHGHLDIVKLLIERGADIHAIWNGRNVLMEAGMYGKQQVVDYLRSLGLKDLRETTPPDFPASHALIKKLVAAERGALTSWSTSASDDPAVMLHATKYLKKRDAQTIFTVGLSDHFLYLPHGQPIATELSIMLPKSWPLKNGLLSPNALKKPEWNWPIEGLKRLVRERLASRTWPREQAAVFMQDEPLGPNTKLSGWLVLDAGSNHQMPDYRWLDLRDAYPIYAEEAALIESAGYEELMRRLEQQNVPRPIDPQRVNVG